MIYRYSVCDRGGETLSRHRNYLGALDGLARLRAAAKREGRESETYIYDGRLKRRVPDSISLLADDVAALQVALRQGDKARLRQIAAEVGALARSGRGVGEPSLSELLRRIAAGELLVVARSAE